MTATLEMAPELEMEETLKKRAIAPGIDRIVLTGFMGSGKTSVGSMLAERLGWRFLDLDAEIERRDGRTVPAVFAESGEAHFRKLETAALATLLGQRRVVVALGGGAPEELGNRLLLEQTPRTAVVYLEAPLETLLERCELDDTRTGTAVRPLLAQAEQRFAARRHLYERIAAHRIATASRSIEAATDAILETLSRAS
jgi:shikimate kinase